MDYQGLNVPVLKVSSGFRISSAVSQTFLLGLGIDLAFVAVRLIVCCRNNVHRDDSKGVKGASLIEGNAVKVEAETRHVFGVNKQNSRPNRHGTKGSQNQ